VHSYSDDEDQDFRSINGLARVNANCDGKIIFIENLEAIKWCSIDINHILGRFLAVYFEVHHLSSTTGKAMNCIGSSSDKIVCHAADVMRFYRCW
jgi:hypothetical protein